MKLLVLAQAGAVNPITGEGKVRLGVVEVPDGTTVAYHDDVLLPAAEQMVLQKALRQAQDRLGVHSFGALTEAALQSGLTGADLLQALRASGTPDHKLAPAAEYLEKNAQATAEDIVTALQAGLNRGVQPGTIAKAQQILAERRAALAPPPPGPATAPSPRKNGSPGPNRPGPDRKAPAAPAAPAATPAASPAAPSEAGGEGKAPAVPATTASK
jgi:hypothetical protein